MSKRRLTAYFFLLITSIIWGVAGPIIKFTLFEFPPLIFLSYRFLISTVVGLIILSINKPSLPRKTSLVFLLILAGFMLSTLRLGTLFFGIDETTSLAGTVISAAGPVLLALLGSYFFNEHVTRLEKFGMALAFVGTAISVVEPVFASDGVIATTLRGNMLVTLSLFIDIASILLGKYLLKKRLSPLLITNLAFIIGAATIIPIALTQHSLGDMIRTVTNASLSAHMGVWFMALISGTLAYQLSNEGLKRIEVGEASIFTYLTPIWAAPLSLLWLGEKITGPFLFGALLIFIGVAIAEYKHRVN